MFQVGQKVWDVVVGAGVVSRIDSDCRYPVIAKFSDRSVRTYVADGRSVAADINPSLYPYPVEIIKKITKPSINWDHVRKDFKFLSQDRDGNGYLYSEKPVIGLTGWQTTRGDFAEAHSHASYEPGTCDWKHSLVERPDIS